MNGINYEVLIAEPSPLPILNTFRPLGNCWFVSVIPVSKTNNVWKARLWSHFTPKLPKWSFAGLRSNGHEVNSRFKGASSQWPVSPEEWIFKYKFYWTNQITIVTGIFSNKKIKTRPVIEPGVSWLVFRSSCHWTKSPIEHNFWELI